MRIYYPTNNEEPTPALPKGGSMNEAQYSLTTNRLTSNGRHLPSLGERLRVGELRSGMGLGVGVISGGCSAGHGGFKILILGSGG